ncbi:Heterogeneous nuclear ribonucleoprotein Q [Sarcoptes scabiei]|uniref:Heterogeneous nuclear ribonucleoprotein Q n=1 Tax=Sarcoptes scabiei TaxID=52283 RepID=A0A131ZXS8_SARSC|nr:Heterogeneous nuclear ribonucleoprotein Q [Sarcoptes scabiei]KPM02910.1 heterogeneous nuclear ribonucleoprotein r-like protein [Sarcoptes scabiei]
METIANQRSESINRLINCMTPNALKHRPGPDSTKLMDILEKNDFVLEISNNQRKCRQRIDQKRSTSFDSFSNEKEIFVGKIPKDLFEDELIELFETVGRIRHLRLMMNPSTGLSRGYAFIQYFDTDHSKSAIEMFDNYELPKQKTRLKVKMSVPSAQLFIGNISRNMSKTEVFNEFQKITPGLVDVVIYPLPYDRSRNRGFCFLEYESHQLAWQAKRKLTLSQTKIWDTEILVDWADPLERSFDETVSNKIEVLYVRNLYPEWDDQFIINLFKNYGTINRIKRIKNYAFIHFVERGSALNVLKKMSGRILLPDGNELEIAIAKPPINRKKKDEMYHKRGKKAMCKQPFDGQESFFSNNCNINCQSITQHHKWRVKSVPHNNFRNQNSWNNNIWPPSIQINNESLQQQIEDSSSSSLLINKVFYGPNFYNCDCFLPIDYFENVGHSFCHPNLCNAYAYPIHYYSSQNYGPILQIPYRSPVARVSLDPFNDNSFSSSSRSASSSKSGQQLEEKLMDSIDFQSNPTECCNWCNPHSPSSTIFAIVPSLELQAISMNDTQLIETKESLV